MPMLSCTIAMHRTPSALSVTNKPFGGYIEAYIFFVNDVTWGNNLFNVPP